MVKVISISVSDEHKKMLEDMELSPSGLFKQRMEQIKAESFNYNQTILKLQKAVQELGKALNERNEQIELLKNGNNKLD